MDRAQPVDAVNDRSSRATALHRGADHPERFPARSRARAEKQYVYPGVTPDKVTLAAVVFCQARGYTAAPNPPLYGARTQRTSTLARPPPTSLAAHAGTRLVVKANPGVGPVIDSVGATRSTRHEYVAVPVLLDRSVTFTVNV